MARIGCSVDGDCAEACEGVEETGYVTLNPGAVAACNDVGCLHRVGVACYGPRDGDR